VAEDQQEPADPRGLGERLQALEDVQRATLNILEDFDGERAKAADTQRALLNILEDIETERITAAEAKALLESVKRTAEELERSNKDLEQFAYVASHDLQEPLRAVSGFVALLQHRYGDSLDDKAREYIGAAVDGAQRMQTLIDDLLEYSRVGTGGRTLEPTSARTALDRAIANLDASIREAEAVITADPLPVVPADGVQLAQLFQNLIGNAIKFRSDRPPSIHVACQHRRGSWIISVQDNGIGIERQYAERIFLIFQRLHTRRNYPGTGIGLAICRRIVERHGGRIWVESQPEQGATFSFSIPDGGIQQ
jgi:light-regulated signal transduction histidine kinase (bacteriophytochrome)